MSELELVELGKFNPNNVIFGIPEDTDIKDGNVTTGTYQKCTLSYKNSVGDEVPLIMEAPKVFCYGPQKEYKWGCAKTPEHFKGYNLCYYLSDPTDSTKEPTNDQKTFLKSIRQLEKKLVLHMKEHADYLSEGQAELASAEKLVSLIARHPKKEEDTGKKDKKGQPIMRKVTDTTKPLRFYARLIQNKKTGDFITTFYGPGDREIDPLDFLDARGYIEPAIKFEYIYIGTLSATFQIKLWECNYTPIEGSQRKRLIRKNTDPSPEDVPSTSNPNNDLDSDEDTPANNSQENSPKQKPKVKAKATAPTKVVRKKVVRAQKPKTPVSDGED